MSWGQSKRRDGRASTKGTTRPPLHINGIKGLADGLAATTLLLLLFLLALFATIAVLGNGLRHCDRHRRNCGADKQRLQEPTTVLADVSKNVLECFRHKTVS